VGTCYRARGSERTTYGIADDRTSKLSEWDDDVLAELLGGLREDGLDLGQIGFDDDDIAKLLGDVTARGLTDPDDVPEPPAEPVTRPGDLWLLGRHRVLCGDSTEPDVYARLLDGRAARMVFTSFPYAVGADYGTTYDDSIGELRRLLASVPKLLAEHVRDGGYVLVNFGDIVSAQGMLATDEPCE
jgi:hypothetical protein